MSGWDKTPSAHTGRARSKPKIGVVGQPLLDTLYEVHLEAMINRPLSVPPRPRVVQFASAVLGDIPRENTMLPGDWDEVSAQTQTWAEYSEDGEQN